MNVALTQGLVALCDESDAESLQRYRWHALRIHNRTYAATQINGKRMYMHRFLMPNAAEIDHRNRDGLDNRRENLRECTHSQNLANAEFPVGATGYRGVRVMRSKYQARIKVDQTYRHLGTFDTAEQAARAYDTAAREAFGEFAYQNF
jgi:hypothetical protein